MEAENGNLQTHDREERMREENGGGREGKEANGEKGRG